MSHALSDTSITGHLRFGAWLREQQIGRQQTERDRDWPIRNVAMATPIMAMGVNAGLYLINQLQQLACVIIDDHDRVYTSKEVNYLS